MGGRKTRLWCGLGIALIGSLCGISAWGQATPLFVPTGLSLSIGPDGDYVDEFVRLSDAAKTALPHWAEARAFSLAAHDGAWALRVDGITWKLDGGITIRGVVEGIDGSSFALRRLGGGVSGSIRMPGDGVYDVFPLSPTEYAIRKWLIDGATCAGPMESITRAEVPSPPKQPGDPPVVDLLVVYTPAARLARGGEGGIVARIEEAVDATNQAYRNSEVAHRLRLVGTAEVNYTQSGDLLTDIEALTNPEDGLLDEVPVLRDGFNADDVSLFVDGGRGGIGWQMRSVSPGFQDMAYNVVDQEVAANFFVLAHEAGHNMGCSHENADGMLGAFGFSHALVTPLFGTLMNARTSASTIQHFSNPFVFDGDVQTGEAVTLRNASDNAQTLNATAETVAAFRDTLFEVSPYEQTVSAEGAPVAYTTMYRGETVSPWVAEVAPGVDWISFPFGNEGVGSDNLLVTVSPNGDNIERAVEVRFRSTRGDAFDYTVTIVQPRCDGPLAPGAVSASDRTSAEGIRVVWSVATGAAEYRVYRARDASGANMVPVSPWTTTLAFFDSAAGQVGAPFGCAGIFDDTLFYTVRARNACGESSFSPFDEGAVAQGSAKTSDISAFPILAALGALAAYRRRRPSQP